MAHYWTKPRIIEAAKACETRIQFKRKHPSAYRLACRKGWLSEALAHLPQWPATGPYKWTFEAALGAARRYTDLDRFRVEQSGLLCIAISKGWYAEITSHMPRKRGGLPQRWTRDAASAEAAKYQTRQQFRELSGSCYVIAKRNRWLDEICAHMKRERGNAFRSVYVIRAPMSKRIYIGLSYSPQDRYAAHARKGTKAVRDMIAGPHAFKVVTRLIPTDDAAKIEAALIQKFRKAGWDILNVKSGGDVGGTRRKWTRQALQAAADICVTRGEFSKRFASGYRTACQQGLMDDLFKRHDNAGYERCRAVADDGT